MAAHDGQVSVCGYSGTATGDLRSLYDEGVRPLNAQGLLLAAGAGTRMGRPKALVHDADGTSWLQHAVEVLRDGGCNGVTVVLGAEADEAVRLLDGLGVDVVLAHDWAEGMSASLRAGLESLPGSDAEAAVVSLVDLPDLTAAVVRRVLSEREGDEALARASYHGRPGHPVVLGRAHWPAVVARRQRRRGRPRLPRRARHRARRVRRPGRRPGRRQPALRRRLRPTGPVSSGCNRSSPGISVGWQSQPFPHDQVRVRGMTAAHARCVVRQRFDAFPGVLGHGSAPLPVRRSHDGPSHRTGATAAACANACGAVSVTGRTRPDHRAVTFPGFPSTASMSRRRDVPAAPR